jgi:DNA-binding CsgD family transcriptional regulator
VELIADTAKTFPGKGIPISPFITQSMINELIGVQRNDFEAMLSKREHEILQQLADGSSYKMIASNLMISIETVRHHIKNLYKKLDVKSKGEIIAKLLKKP